MSALVIHVGDDGIPFTTCPRCGQIAEVTSDDPMNASVLEHSTIEGDDCTFDQVYEDEPVRVRLARFAAYRKFPVDAVVRAYVDKEPGWDRPIHIDRFGRIVDGNHRVAAAIRRGDRTIWAYRQAKRQ